MSVKTDRRESRPLTTCFLCYFPKCWPLESLKRVEIFPPGLFRLVSAVMPALRHRERGPGPGCLPRAHPGDAPRPLRGDPLGNALRPLGLRAEEAGPVP